MSASTAKRSLVTEPADQSLVTEPAQAGEPVRLTVWLRGRVQGVGMRWWVRSRALELGLVGWARNLEDGRVEVVAEGAEAACQGLLALLRSGDTPGLQARPGRIEAVVQRWSQAGGLAGKDDPGFVER